MARNHSKNSSYGGFMNEALGTKRHCPQCQAKFYDLRANPVVCPKCAYTFPDESASSRKQHMNGKAAIKVKKPVVRVEEIEELKGMGEVHELEELDAFDEDVGHLEEVEDHSEESDLDLNSDDADDDMFIDELAASDIHLVDEVEEDSLDGLEDEERDSV